VSLAVQDVAKLTNYPEGRKKTNKKGKRKEVRVVTGALTIFFGSSRRDA